MRLELHHKADIYELATERPTTEDLQRTHESNTTIAIAIGIVMDRFALTDERALAYLVSVAQSGNIKLRTLAHQMVDEANGGPVERINRSAPARDLAADLT